MSLHAGENVLIHQKIKDKKGFSLVELAIVLVIIGLLLAALSKGKAILENARIKRVIGDIESVVTAYNTYYDQYSAYPGDDLFASGRWASVVVTDGTNFGNSYIEDTGDGDCESDPADGSECNEAWQALRAASMVTGNLLDTGEDALPSHTLGGRMWFENSLTDDLTEPDFGELGDRNYLGISNLRGEIAQVIDEKFDDGVWDSGSVQGSADFNADPDISVNLFYAL